MESTLKLKKLSAFPAVFNISLVASGQTSLNKVLFNKICEYKVSEKFKEIKWYPTVYKAAQHH